MDKKVIELFGLVFRILLRYWVKDNTSFIDIIMDIEQFAQECKLTKLDARKFNRTIDEFIDLMAEEFIKEFQDEIIEKDSRNIILNQIHSDVDKLNLDVNKFIVSIHNSEDLQSMIIAQSQKEREGWNDTEVGIYFNCVRYISKAGINFISELPQFKSEMLRTIFERQNEYYSKLYNILKDFHAITASVKNEDEVYREYERLYRERIVEKYSKIELIGSGIKERKLRKYELSSAYVELSCVDRYNYGKEIKLSQVFNYNNVVWIKGEAGSGKTTFLQWVAVCSAKNEYNEIEKIRNSVPIVISLRSASWPIKLQNEIDKLTGEYEDSRPKGWITHLFESGNAILLFDGLDEIHQKKREDIYDFIEHIVKRYPQIKILLTARNSVKDIISNSAEYEILPMNMSNISKFILYWHKSILWNDAIVKDQKIETLQRNLIKCISENHSLKILARNPLLCAMICALNYTDNEKLPRNKMDLYEECCKMLIDARDIQRNVDNEMYGSIPRLEYSRKRKILEEISFWMMDNNVSEERKESVINFLGNLIEETNIIPDRHTHNAELILEYLVGRSGILREPVEDRIDFIHKTFMEFLAVKVICRNWNWNVLVREACNENWRETIIMCFQEMNKENVEYVLKRFVAESEKRNDNRYILMASLAMPDAVFLSDNKLKEIINSKTKEIISQKINNVLDSDLIELAKTGTYLLPFLKDSDCYSNDEKEKYLLLLRHINTEEAIPDILSYALGNGNYSVKIKSLQLLKEFMYTSLEEYNVFEQLGDKMLIIPGQKASVSMRAIIRPIV